MGLFCALECYHKDVDWKDIEKCTDGNLHQWHYSKNQNSHVLICDKCKEERNVRYNG
jgi:hypothetical protein